jgi:prepilin-type N-terminal cleavage/methylation domain-containing protein
MMVRSIRFSRRRRRGATLIEVIAGLVVLGVLVTSVTLARARAGRQWAEAERRLAAARALDGLVASWFDGSGETIPVAGRGELAGAPGCTWRTTAYGDPAVRELGAGVVRVEVLDGRRVILSLELLKRAKVREGAQ